MVSINRQNDNKMVIVNVVEVDINTLADLAQEAQVPEYVTGYLAALTDPSFPDSPALEQKVFDAIFAAAGAADDFEDSLTLVPSQAIPDVLDAVAAELNVRLFAEVIADALPQAANF